MTWAKRWLCRLKIFDKDGVFDLVGVIQAVGTIIGIIIAFILSDRLQEMLYKNVNWILFFFVTLVLIIIITIIWNKLVDRIRALIQSYKKYEKLIKSLIIVLQIFVVIFLIYWIFIGPLSASPLDSPFDPSGKMGDIGDITIIRMSGYDQFTYTAKGIGPHEWDWKYRDDGSLNPEPAQFGGVMYLYPPNNWGNLPGYDLRSYRGSVTWEARSVGDNCTVEFVMGGIQWKWDNESKSSDLKHPDSMLRKSIGIKKLTNEWQKFSSDLSAQPMENSANVIGGFGWIIPWGSNNISLNENRTEAQNPKTFTIEIRNLQYH
jgi:hypothetical protein